MPQSKHGGNGLDALNTGALFVLLLFPVVLAGSVRGALLCIHRIVTVGITMEVPCGSGMVGVLSHFDGGFNHSESGFSLWVV